MDEHGELLAAIGRALGEPGPYRETIGAREDAINLGNMTSPPISLTKEVLGGAFDARGRAAWIEMRSDVPQDGYVPVEIDLRLAWDGALQRVDIVDTYNPYFGCRVMLARWYGDDFVFVYREKHKMIVSRLAPPYELQATHTLSDALIEDRDVLYYLKDGALHGCALPALEPTSSVPVERPDRWAYQELSLEAPGLARIATIPDRKELSWEERLALGRASALTVRLPRDR